MRKRMTCSCYAAWEAMVHEGIERESIGPSDDVLGYRELMRSATKPKNSRKLVSKSEEKGAATTLSCVSEADKRGSD